MNIRKTLVSLSLVVSVVPAAFADNIVPGEVGQVVHPPSQQSSLTRGQVQREAQAFRKHPVLSDGTVFLPGEAGYMSPNQGAFADQQPKGPHTHSLDGSAAAAKAPAMSDAERRAYREQYIN